MKDLKLTTDEIQGPLPIDEIVEKIYTSYKDKKIERYSREFDQFRNECSKQLQSLSKDQVKEISKALLLRYDLRLLGYELIYYHES